MPDHIHFLAGAEQHQLAAAGHPVLPRLAEGTAQGQDSMPAAQGAGAYPHALRAPLGAVELQLRERLPVEADVEAPRCAGRVHPAFLQLIAQEALGLVDVIGQERLAATEGQAVGEGDVQGAAAALEGGACAGREARRRIGRGLTHGRRSVACCCRPREPGHRMSGRV
ncbi:hypothetical protein D9M70_515390 [compost metagenome]